MNQYYKTNDDVIITYIDKSEENHSIKCRIGDIKLLSYSDGVKVGSNKELDKSIRNDIVQEINEVKSRVENPNKVVGHLR